MRRLANIALLALFPLMLAAVAVAEPPASVPLWSEGAPGSAGKSGEEVAELYLALRKAGVPAELHIYDRVGHGFGLRARNQGPAAAWPQRLLEWMDERGIAKLPAAVNDTTHAMNSAAGTGLIPAQLEIDSREATVDPHP